MPFNKKKSQRDYIDDNRIFGLIRSCQGLRLRICNPLTDWWKKGDAYIFTACLSVLIVYFTIYIIQVIWEEMRKIQ